MKSKILLVDDQSETRTLIGQFLELEGYEPIVCASATDALDLLISNKANPDVVVTDINMPGMNGLEFCSILQNKFPEIPVIVITANVAVDYAINALRLGAYDYLIKPLKLPEFSISIERALENLKLKNENSLLRKEVKRSWSMGELIGKSSGLKSVFELIERVSHANSTVLILGESGTGKELVAKSIHQKSPRAAKPFVAINCSAIPEALLESELFGHAKGAFTGAAQRKRGLIEEAEGGTLFLDEIGEMNVHLQSKILRIIQERKLRAVGENTEISVDVRFIAATHKDLKAAIKSGNFREDLYYRLSVIPIVIPPLRHRKGDIPLLAEHFLTKYAALNNIEIHGFSSAAIRKLTEMKWDGNVRELENAIERAVVLSKNKLIEAEDFTSPENIKTEEFYGDATNDLPTLSELEKRYIQLVLDKTGSRKDTVARILGINRRTLYRKEKEYGLTTLSENASPEEI